MAHPNSWEDWEDWQDWGEPNRYGYYGLNCKNRPSGTGTTHSNRREQRRYLQWENLTKATPDTEESLASQAAALEKAAAKAKKKLEEMKKKRKKKRKKRKKMKMMTCLLPQNPMWTTGRAKKRSPARRCFGKGTWGSFGKGWQHNQKGKEGQAWPEGTASGGKPFGKGAKNKARTRWAFGKGPQSPKEVFGKGLQRRFCTASSKVFGKGQQSRFCRASIRVFGKGPNGSVFEASSQKPSQSQAGGSKAFGKGQKTQGHLCGGLAQHPEDQRPGARKPHPGLKAAVQGMPPSPHSKLCGKSQKRKTGHLGCLELLAQGPVPPGPSPLHLPKDWTWWKVALLLEPWGHCHLWWLTRGGQGVHAEWLDGLCHLHQVVQAWWSASKFGFQQLCRGSGGLPLDI